VIGEELCAEGLYLTVSLALGAGSASTTRQRLEVNARVEQLPARLGKPQPHLFPGSQEDYREVGLPDFKTILN
jgi:hypothetical protein